MQLCVVVNPRSGGGQGLALLRAWQEVVGPDNAVAIADMAEAVSRWCQQWAHRPWRLVAAGGDGTVAALLNLPLQGHDLGCLQGVAIWPLGTGNDLARSSGWGSGRHDGFTAAGCRQFAELVRQAVPQRVDRWMLQGPDQVRYWYNYCGLGLDGYIAAGFDHLRKRHTFWFRRAWINKIAYGLLVINRLGRGGGVVYANIPSYAGGLHLGQRVRCDDARCDCFAIAGVWALVMLVLGRSLPLVASERQHRFCLPRATWIQLDGEAVPAAAGHYHIALAGQATLLHGPAATVDGSGPAKI